MTDISVIEAAAYWGCSTRRIRTLLSQGRMTGFKKGLEWRVLYPIQCTIGKRGPLLKLRKQGRYLREKAGIQKQTITGNNKKEAENPS